MKTYLPYLGAIATTILTFYLTGHSYLWAGLAAVVAFVVYFVANFLLIFLGPEYQATIDDMGEAAVEHYFKEQNEKPHQTNKETLVRDSDLTDFWELAFEQVRRDSRYVGKFVLDGSAIISNEQMDDANPPSLFISADFETTDGKLLHIAFVMESDIGYAFGVECLWINK